MLGFVPTGHTCLKADGKDILAVTMVLNAERDGDAPSPNL